MKRRWLIVLLLVLAAGAGGFLLRDALERTVSIEITKGMIDAALAKKFPKEKTYLKIVRVSYVNPRAVLLPDQDKVCVSLDVRVAVGVAGLEKTYSGSASLITRVGYNPADYRFYLETLGAMRESVMAVPAPGVPWTPWKDPAMPRCAVIARLIMPALGNCLKKGVELETKLDLAILGLELETAAAANGTYPAALPAGAGPTLDPFSGKAFLYRPATNSVLLYSVGADGRDDGGNRKASAAVPGSDLVWRVERP